MIGLAFADGISIRDVATGKTVKRLQPASEDCGMAVSPDERLLAAARNMKDKDDKATHDVAVWDLATEQLIAVIPVDQSVRFQIANDNQTLVTADDQMIVVWDIATGQVRSRWELPSPGRDIYGSPPVNRLLISADGRRVVTSMLDGTALVWDMTKVPRRPTQTLTTEALFTCCDDLKHENAAKAYAAIWRLVDSPAKDVVAMLRSKLKPADDSAAEKVRDLIKKLDSDKFAEREGASRQIAEVGSAAEPVLRWTLEQEPSAEARRRIETLLEKATNPVLSTDDLAAMRAVQVVERLATHEARELLTHWAKGTPHAPLTREAKAANDRLNISR